MGAEAVEKLVSTYSSTDDESTDKSDTWFTLAVLVLLPFHFDKSGTLQGLIIFLLDLHSSSASSSRGETIKEPLGRRGMLKSLQLLHFFIIRFP